jgi:L-ascorbate metabolism protein UlaG (beta-lactamase superfamily)
MERDEAGRCRFLGYVVEGGGTSIFHSGDCVPYEGQVEDLARAAPDLTLLPRRQLQRRRGAVAFVPSMIAHHYGMCAFNTVEPAAIDDALAVAPVHALRAHTHVAWTLRLN